MENIIIFIAVVINVIVLICFFVLCSQVSHIRKVLKPRSNTYEELDVLIALGQKEKAKSVLINLILSDNVFDFESPTEESIKATVKRYKKYMDEVSLEFDAQKFIEARKNF